MFSPVFLLIIATLLPLAGFLVLVFIGKRLAAPLAGWVGTGFIVGSFGFTFLAMVKWYVGTHGPDSWGMGDRPLLRTIAFLPAGGGIQQEHPGFLDVGVFIDSLTIAIFATITLVAAIIHIFSITVMRRDEHFPRFFAFMGLACFAVLGLVVGGTLLHVLIFWLLISLCSSLMIGYAFDTSQRSAAALRAFIIHLIGDAFFIVGFGILFSKVGNVTLPWLWATLGNASSGRAVVLPGGGVLSNAFLTMTCICLFLGAAAKSAQFPLHVWLADSGKAPIPGSALICTVTTTLAGVYFVGRLFPILTPDARLFIAIIGVVTLTMGALIAMAQDELPRMLVWTAVSQFGYMMLAIGVGSWIGGLFHLMTACFILALLFLSASSVIEAANGERRISRLGGMLGAIPVTAGAMGVAVLALTGAHLLSGHYSQAIIANDAAAFASYATRFGHRAWGYWLFFVLPALVVYVTAFYLARCWMLIFAGAPPSPDAYRQAREDSMLWGPLLALAGPTLIAGYAMNVPELLRWSIVENQSFCNELLAPGLATEGGKFTGFDQAWPAKLLSPAEPSAAEAIDAGSSVAPPAAEAHERGHTLALAWVSFAWVLGIGLGVGAYWNGKSAIARFVRRAPLGWIRTWLADEMYFDELYYWTAGRLVAGLSLVVWAVDRYIVNAIAHGVTRLVRRAVAPGLSRK